MKKKTSVWHDCHGHLVISPLIYKHLHGGRIEAVIKDGMLCIPLIPILEEQNEEATRITSRLLARYGNCYYHFSDDVGSKTSICIIEIDGRIHIGTAICDPSDPYSVTIGRAIALCRATNTPVPEILLGI